MKSFFLIAPNFQTGSWQFSWLKADSDVEKKEEILIPHKKKRKKWNSKCKGLGQEYQQTGGLYWHGYWVPGVCVCVFINWTHTGCCKGLQMLIIPPG